MLVKRIIHHIWLHRTFLPCEAYSIVPTPTTIAIYGEKLALLSADNRYLTYIVMLAQFSIFFCSSFYIGQSLQLTVSMEQFRLPNTSMWCIDCYPSYFRLIATANHISWNSSFNMRLTMDLKPPSHLPTIVIWPTLQQCLFLFRSIATAFIHYMEQFHLCAT